MLDAIMSESLQLAKRVMITSWVATFVCILLYLGIGIYAHDVLGYNSIDAMEFAPKGIRYSVYFACTCGFVGIFSGAPVAIISTIIYFVQRKKK